MKANILSKTAAGVLFIAFLAAGVFSPLASLTKGASADTSIVLQPSKTEVKASPGQKLSRTFSVINRSNYYVRLKLVVKDFRQASDDGRLEFYDEKSESAATWLIPEFLEIGLKPLSTKDISFVVSVPKDLSAGGHYGAIMFQPADAPQGQAISANSFGELVLLTVAANDLKTTAIAKTSGFGTSPFQQGEPVDFSFKIENSGNTHFTTQGRLVVKDWLGKEVGNFDAGQLIVYPNTSRVFKWRWTETPVMGIYRANLMLSDPDYPNTQKQKLIDGAWFILLPWQILVGFLAVIAALFLALKYRKNLYLKKINIKNLGIRGLSSKN